VSAIEIVVCYAREDEAALKELLVHLGVLKRQGFFDVWYDREISAGTERMREIDKHLDNAQIILLLISQYFMNSNYCYLVEMQRAIERHEKGEARVIPILLRPVYYERAPFSKLQALPTSGLPVMGSGWHSQDEAFFAIAEGIRKAVEELLPSPRLSQQRHEGR
jgi:hypothetical protein